MTKIHSVQQGETISSIARKYGFPDWQSLYNHPDNQALKKLRPNPDIIYPKDEVIIPDRNSAIFKAKVNQKHSFRTKSKLEKVSFKLGAIDGITWPNRKVQLLIDEVVIESKTDKNAIVEFKLPKNHSHTAHLLIFTEKEERKPCYKVEVTLGHLDPITETIGQQARLNALGFDCGILTGQVNSRFEEAVSAFQAEHGLSVDGVCGANTQNVLEQEYGC